MIPRITAEQVKSWLSDANEIAFIDVREHGQYGEAHPFLAVSIPYSRLELDIKRLVPRLSTRIVLFDEGDGVAERAAERLTGLGYTGLHVLEGGVQSWGAAGFGLFQGVHLPSKTFGELVEHAYHTPRLQAPELSEMIERGEPVVVLDGRPLDEFRKMSIPGATCCPNAELPLRIHTLISDESIPIVINCAGRTRSIIGAQTLINVGVKNPVYALENGTQGWYLNDLPLEHGASRHYKQVDAQAPVLGMRRSHAAAQAQRHGAADVDVATLQLWLADSDRSTFLLDVRTPEEFAAGSLPGAQHAPGGQLLQGTDLYVGVKGARLVVTDDDGVRARMVASWLRQMGHETYVLPPQAWNDARSTLKPPRYESTCVEPTEISSSELAHLLGLGEVQIIDVRPSMAFRKGRIEGSTWSTRARINRQDFTGHPLVLVADRIEIAALAALELTEAQRAFMRVFVEPATAWKEAGLPVSASPEIPCDAECIDFLFFVHDRHDGNKEAARRYLAWETGLIAQLDAQERSIYRIVTD